MKHRLRISVSAIVTNVNVLLCLPQVERTEFQHEGELKSASKKIRSDQEKELRSFRDSLKTELKLLKQEIDLLPKDVRKEALRSRKEHLETDQAEREKAFLERMHQNHEVRS